MDLNFAWKDGRWSTRAAANIHRILVAVMMSRSVHNQIGYNSCKNTSITGTEEITTSIKKRKKKKKKENKQAKFIVLCRSAPRNPIQPAITSAHNSTSKRSERVF